MKKYIVQYCHAQVVGTDMAEACLAKNEEEAAAMFYDTARDWADGYNDDFSSEEECNWECWAEEYDPEKHDGLKCGPGDWKWK